MREILIVLAIVLVIFGHRKIKDFGKSLGEGLRNFKKALEGEGDKVANTNANTTNADLKDSNLAHSNLSKNQSTSAKSQDTESKNQLTQTSSEKK